MSRITTKRSVFSVVTAACLVSGFALTGLVPASAATNDVAKAQASSSAFGTGKLLAPAATDVPADAATPENKAFWEANQAPLGDATALIEEQFSGEFAYAFFDDSSAMHVAFSGAAPAEAVALLENTGLPYVVVESVGFNAAEYQAAADSVGEQTRQYVTEERGVSISQSPSTAPGAIQVSFQSEDPELTSDPGITAPMANARSSQGSAETAPALSVDGPFSITFDDTYTSPYEFSSYGRAAGMWLINTSGSGVCTAGFVVKSNSSSSLGMLTAGHCPNSVRYYNPNNGEVQQLNMEAKHQGMSGDVMFQRSPVMMDAWFHYGPNVGKPVTSVRNPVDNEYVFSYGRESNYEHFGLVVEANTEIQRLINNKVVNIGQQVQVQHTMKRGDSGAPLYSGNSAKGVLSSTSQNNVIANYTRITAAQSSLNVTVCKDPVCS